MADDYDSNTAAAADGADGVIEAFVSRVSEARWLSEMSDVQLEYWRNQLGANGGPAPLDLPADRPRPKRQPFNGAYVDFSVPSDIVAQLRRLGNAHGASLYMTLGPIEYNTELV